ncbi:unnamed protein product [Rotaria sordida]|uniref:Uncharacterized protein n=1 Tax=Rotaria sordida TaxID=392033 RepID=A0A815J9L5_9BILA|nr:unnamed protein product [Rotaria sordida]
MGYYEDFVYGFLTNPSGPDTFGRPVGLLVLKDGSLLFSEDGNNRLYQNAHILQNHYHPLHINRLNSINFIAGAQNLFWKKFISFS